MVKQEVVEADVFFETDGDNTYFSVYLNEQKDVNGLKAQEVLNNIIQGYFLENIK